MLATWLDRKRAKGLFCAVSETPRYLLKVKTRPSSFGCWEILSQTKERVDKIFLLKHIDDD